MCASREVPLSDLTDEQLAVLVRDSSEEAFSLLVARCTGMIQHLAASFRGSSVDAEDLAQEGLLGLLSAARTFREDGGAAFRTYASVCIRRRMLSAVQRAGEEPELSRTGWMDAEHTECSDVPGAAEIDPAQLVVQREDMQRLDNRLREILTSLEYEVLMLYFGAYTYEEIAQRLGIRTKAVDNALQRIRRKLASKPLLD